MTDFHRTPHPNPISKLCIKCHKNSLIDDIEFIRECNLTKYFKGDICIECHPHLYTKYKKENPILSRLDRDIANRLSQQQSFNLK